MVYILNLLIFSLLALLGVCYPHYNYSASVTYELNPDARLGDNLLCYLHAKWLSYRYDIPLLYKPFLHADKFAFDSLELRYSEENRIKKKICNKRLDKLTSPLFLKSDILFVVPYFPESYGELEVYKNREKIYFPHFSVDWKDVKFRTILLEALKPKEELKLTLPPQDKISVAIHVRMGGGFDREDLGLDPLFTGKLPPKKFYLDALEALCKLLPHEELFFYIFTDDPYPDDIASYIEEHLQKLRLAPFSIGYRISGNSHEKNILEDMFSMMQFDCLIRPESNFSIIPSLLKDYKILIHPLEWYTKADPLSIKLNIVSKLE